MMAEKSASSSRSSNANSSNVSNSSNANNSNAANTGPSGPSSPSGKQNVEMMLNKYKQELEHEHSSRIVRLKEKGGSFERESARLREYMQNSATVVTTVANEIDQPEKLLEEQFGYQRREQELEFHSATSGNNQYCQLFLYNKLRWNEQANKFSIERRIACRRYSLQQPEATASGMSESFRDQFLSEGLKIWKYFQIYQQELELANNADSNYAADNINKPTIKVQKLYEIVRLTNNDKSSWLYVFQERINPAHSLRHRQWATSMNNVNCDMVKNWILQLANALDCLNTAGVAHRYVRMENILVADNRVKLTNFDLACLYWNPDERKPIVQSRGLPVEIPQTQWDHLPPECFNDDGYDASMVDVWSLGVVICELKTKNNPFDIDKHNSSISNNNNNQGLIQQWLQCYERRTLLEEFRTLLDNIFDDFDQRIPILDLKGDKRLHFPSSVFHRIRIDSYYRIDLDKNRNISRINKSKSQIPKRFSESEFDKNSIDIYRLIGYQTTSKSEDEMCQIRHYSILREESFDPQFQDQFVNDNYLKAVQNCSSPIAAGSLSPRQLLVKIKLLSRIPIRHRNLLLNESSRIWSYFSRQKPHPAVHRVLAIVSNQFSEPKLYIFCENLPDYRSIYGIINSNEFDSSTSSSKSKEAQLKAWAFQLCDLIRFLDNHGISHRYIRPEYVFVSNSDSSTIKLSHFDQACFVWNPASRTQVLRHRGLQDELVQHWSHLPPECFDDKYDSRLVDVWGFGVLLVWCLTKKNPFRVPLIKTTASPSSSSSSSRTSRSFWKQWRQFRTQFEPTLTAATTGISYLDILDRIFKPVDERISSSKLVAYFGSNQNFQNNYPNNSTSNIKPKSKQLVKLKKAPRSLPMNSRNSKSTSTSTSRKVFNQKQQPHSMSKSKRRIKIKGKPTSNSNSNRKSSRSNSRSSNNLSKQQQQATGSNQTLGNATSSNNFDSRNSRFADIRDYREEDIMDDYDNLESSESLSSEGEEGEKDAQQQLQSNSNSKQQQQQPKHKHRNTSLMKAIGKYRKRQQQQQPKSPLPPPPPPPPTDNN